MKIGAEDGANGRDSSVDNARPQLRRSSSSMLGRLFGSNAGGVYGSTSRDSCPWQYEFSFETNERVYTLRCATRDDRYNWVRIFRLIVSMNERRLCTDAMNPFDFEAELDAKMNKNNPQSE